MRHSGPSWLFSLLLLAALFPLAADCKAAGLPGAESPEQILMNEYPVLPPEARKRFEITAQDPTAAADLGVSDFFQLVADILKLNIVMADKSKLEGRRVGIVMRDMTIEEAVRLVLQMNDLKAVHFNENTIIVMDQGSKAAYGTKQVRTVRLQHTTIDKVREFINLNKNVQRQLGDNISFDAANNSVIAVDSAENLALLGMVITQLDVPPAKVLEGVKLSFLDFTQFTALARTLGTDIVNRLASIGLSYNQASRQLMVYGTPQDVRLIRNLVAKLDVAPKQVLIDTSFLQVSESFNREFGFKFTNNSITVNQFDRLADMSRVRSQLTGPPAVYPTRTQINYLISKTGAKTLQSPKVRAVDRTAATINIGEIRNIQIQSTATTLGTGLTPGQQQTTFNTQEVPIGVQVNVTPEIHNDDSVTLDMKISVTKVLEIKSFGVDRTTQDSTTKLRIRNGETVVLGGFINQVLNTDDTPLPLIGEIPLLSKLFRNKKRERTDSELVFLLTPYILDFQGKDPNPDPFELKAPTVQAEGPAASAAISIAPTAPLTAIAPPRSTGPCSGPCAESCAESCSGPCAESCATSCGHAALEPARMPDGVLQLGEQVATLPKTFKTTTTRVVESTEGSAKVVFDDGGRVLAKEFTPGKKAADLDFETTPSRPGEARQTAKVSTALGAPAPRPTLAQVAPTALASPALRLEARGSRLEERLASPNNSSRHAKELGEGGSAAIASLAAKAEVRMVKAESAARAAAPGEAQRPRALDAVVRQHRAAVSRPPQAAPAPAELDSFRRLVDLAKSSDLLHARIVKPREDPDGASYSLQSTAYSLRAGEARAEKASAAPREKPAVAAAPQGHGTNHPYLHQLREQRLKAQAAAEFDAAVSASRPAASRKSYDVAAKADEVRPAATSLTRPRGKAHRVAPRARVASVPESLPRPGTAAAKVSAPAAQSPLPTARPVRATAGRVEVAAAAPPARVLMSPASRPAQAAPAVRPPRPSRPRVQPVRAADVEESYSDLAAAPQPAAAKRPVAPAPEAKSASDRELLARLRSLAASPSEPPAAPAARTSENPAERDAALRKRLQSLTASRPAPEEPQERLSGSSFEELARQLERQLGTGGV